MSGGSLEYIYNRVGDAAESISNRSDSPLHRAFAVHLHKVATALHELEWVFSFDKSPGDEDAAIRACLPADAELRQAIADAEKARDELVRVIEDAKR